MAPVTSDSRPAGTKVRLLVCHDCQSVQELPWCGEDPQCQHPGCTEPLEYRLAGHHGHHGNLAGIDQRLWDDMSARPAILRELAAIATAPGTATGLGTCFYDVRSTFREDAMTCWKRHNRTRNCADYMSDRMRLYPDTRAERKEAGLDPKTRPATSLCSFCPYHSVVTQRQRSRRWRYNYDT
jgi:hypothetical protein